MARSRIVRRNRKFDHETTVRTDHAITPLEFPFQLHDYDRLVDSRSSAEEHARNTGFFAGRGIYHNDLRPRCAAVHPLVASDIQNGWVERKSPSG